MKGKVGAVLLAAGYSGRMGTLKALLSWQETTLLEYQLEQLQKAQLSEIVVILGHEAERLTTIVDKIGVDWVYNEQFYLGKTSSIISGIKHLSVDIDGLLITAVDQPVPYPVIDQLIAQWVEQNKLIAVPVYKRKRGHPILFSSSLREQLLNIEEKSQGLRDLLMRYQHSIAEVDVAEEAILNNLNTPRDYERLLVQKKEV